MTKIVHGKIPDWYTEESKQYDLFNENTPNSDTTNNTIEKILKKYKVKTVLDLTCGTGSQVFWLSKRGYKVIGSDINPSMLRVAKAKAKKEKMPIQWLRADMRTIQVGQFDAALTIFNAIGHLTKKDFAKTLRNIHSNLYEGGIYLFDIFNLDYFNQGDNISQLTIDWVKKVGNNTQREIQYSIIDNKGILVSYTTSYAQKSSGKVSQSQSIGTLQLYTAAELKTLLNHHGFKVLRQCEMDGSKFSTKTSQRILTIAKKIT